MPPEMTASRLSRAEQVRERRIKVGGLFGILKRFQRRGGRKRIVTPDGSEIVPTSKPQPTARWSRPWRGRTDGSGCWRAASTRRWPSWLTPNGSAARYVSRVLRLTLLAPDIVERILDGRPTAGLPQLLEPFPVEWETQRQRLL